MDLDDGHVHDHHHYEVVNLKSNTTIDKLIITDTKVFRMFTI